jgi:hypothetical protein
VHDTGGVKKDRPFFKGPQGKNRAHKVGQVARLGFRVRPQQSNPIFWCDLPRKPWRL